MTAPLTARLVRHRSGDAGTFGTLSIAGQTFLTGELPWRDNAPFRSCIPAGRYLCKWLPSNRFGHAYEITGVPARTRCLIHVANFFGDQAKGYATDVDGCIGLGTAPGLFAKKGYVRAQETLSGSADAVAAFHKLTDGQDIDLVIVDEYLETGQPAPAALA